MSGNYTAQEIERFEELDYQIQKEGMLNYLNHSVPISASHQRWIKEKNSKNQAGHTSSYAPSPTTSAETPQREAYQPQFQADSYQAGPSYYQDPNLANTGNYDQTYQSSLVASPDPGPSQNDWANINSSSYPHYQDINSYTSPPEQGPQYQQAVVTPTMEAMKKLADNRVDIQVWGKKGWKPFKAILDSGTKENWMPRTVSDRLGLEVRSGLPKIFADFEGKRVSSVSTAEATWGIDGRSKTDITVFRIVEGSKAPFDVLFGSNIMSSGEVDFWPDDPALVLTEEKIQEAEGQRIEENALAAQRETERLDAERRQQEDAQRRDKREQSSKSSHKGSKHGKGRRSK